MKGFDFSRFDFLIFYRMPVQPNRRSSSFQLREVDHPLDIICNSAGADIPTDIWLINGITTVGYIWVICGLYGL